MKHTLLMYTQNDDNPGKWILYCKEDYTNEPAARDRFTTAVAHSFNSAEPTKIQWTEGNKTNGLFQLKPL